MELLSAMFATLLLWAEHPGAGLSTAELLPDSGRHLASRSSMLWAMCGSLAVQSCHLILFPLADGKGLGDSRDIVVVVVEVGADQGGTKLYYRAHRQARTRALHVHVRRAHLHGCQIPPSSPAAPKAHSLFLMSVCTVNRGETSFHRNAGER